MMNHEGHQHKMHGNDGSHIIHGIDLDKVNISSLPKNQQEHLLMHEKHRGHESMHATMLLILIFAIFIAQIILIWWRKKSFKSYQNFSMFGMWLVPQMISCYNHYWRFTIIWTFITLVTLVLIYKPLLHKNLNLSGFSIPRLVYRWFFYLYAFSSFCAFAGYALVMLTLLGINVLLGITPMITLDAGVLLLFYGIYYGVLTRDFTDFLVDMLAANIGYYSPSSSLPSKQLNSKICAICGRPHGGPMLKSKDSARVGLLEAADLMQNETNGSSFANGSHDGSVNEKTYTLTCGHIYHQYCIFGWCLIGKKQICPFCREKVDLNKLFASLPFQKPHYLYGNLLDFIRYLVAWQPIIIFAVQCVNHLLGLE